MQIKTTNLEIKYKVLECNEGGVKILVAFVGLSPGLKRFCSNTSYAAKAKFTDFSALTVWLRDSYTAAGEQSHSDSNSLVKNRLPSRNRQVLLLTVLALVSTYPGS